MSKLHEQFVPYQQSFDMKELEFDEPCFGFYDKKRKYQEGDYDFKVFKQKCKNIDKKKPTDMDVDKMCLVPTFTQAFKFFREKYGFFTYPNRTIGSQGIWYYFCIEPRTNVCEGSFIYEEAELTCLKILINIVKTKKL